MEIVCYRDIIGPNLVKTTFIFYWKQNLAL